MMDQPTPPPLPEEPVAHEQAAPPEPMTVDELLAQITPRVWVTPALTVLIVIAFGIELALGVSLTHPTGAQLLEAGGDFGPSLADGEYWRVVTAMFLHSGPLHLAFNVWAFWSVGHLTERVFGNRSFLAIYLLSGIAGALTSVAWNPLVVGVGASGAIFGVYGALLAFVLLHRGVFPAEYLAQQRNSIIGFVGYNIVFGLSQKNTDMAAHAGGMVAGALAGSVLSRDLLRPAEHATRRLGIAVGLAVALAAAAYGVRARTLKVPAIREDRDATDALADLKNKRYPQAIERYTELLAQRRDHAWLFNRGLAYSASGDVKLAVADMREAHALKPGTTTDTMLCELGAGSGAEGETLEQVASHCTAALASTAGAKDKAGLLAARALVRGAQERLAESRADADAALALDEHEVVARAHRASVNLHERKHAEAEADCLRLLAEPAPRAYDLELCARVARAQRDPATERARLDRALTVEPANPYALYGRGWLNGQEGRLAEGIADYGKLVAVDPTSAAAWNNRAWLEIQLGDFTAARADADRAVAQKPDAPSSLGTRCFARVGLGELEAARVDCQRAVELEPSLNDRGMLAFIDKRYEDARRDWTKASAADPVSARELRPWLARLPAR